MTAVTWAARSIRSYWELSEREPTRGYGSTRASS